jgi:hypothetical protein
MAVRGQDIAFCAGRSLAEEYLPDLLAGETVPHPSGERNPVLEMTGSSKQKIYHLKKQQIKTTEQYEQA